MAKKKNFEEGGGLDSLFMKSKPKAAPAISETAEKEEQPTKREGTLSGRGDILSSIEDAELREKLRAKRMDGRGRPRNGVSRESLTQGYTRATMLVNSEKYSRLRDIGLRETKTIKEIIEAAFDLALSKYEETGTL